MVSSYLVLRDSVFFRILYRASYSFVLLFLLVISLSISANALSIDVPSSHAPGQQVYFNVCLNENSNIDITEDGKGIDEVIVSVSCLEDSYLESMMWEDNCLMFGFDSSHLSCEVPIINAKSGYVSVSESTSVIDFSKKLEDSLSSSYVSKPVDAAIMIYSYSLLSDDSYQEEISDLVDYLIVERDNSEKCWPKGDCDLEYTVDVLYYLSQAGFNKENRVYYDALLWVEYHQNSFDNEGWRLDIRPRRSIGEGDEIICSIYLDESELDKVTLTKNNSIERYVFDYNSDKELNVTCDTSFEVRLFNYFNDLLISSWAYEDKHISFFMRGGCWSENVPDWDVHDDGVTLIKGRSVSCIPGLTQRILLLNDLTEPSYDAGVTWLRGEIDRARIAGKQIGVGRGRVEFYKDIISNIDAFLVLRDEEEADELKRQILYTQNNDGSFGFRDSSFVSFDDFFVTLYAIATFSNPSDYEWRNDASYWLLNNRDGVGWSDLVLDAMALNAYGTSDVIVKIEPLMPFMEDSTKDFKLVSDVPFLADINIIQSSNNLNFDTVPNNDVVDVKVSRIFQEDGLITAFMEVFADDFYAKFPFSSYKVPKIFFDFNEEYYFLENEDIIIVPVEKSGSNFLCNISFSDFFNNLSNTNIDTNLFLQYNHENDFSGKVTANTICFANGDIIEESYNFFVRKYNYPPFTVSSRAHSLDKPGRVTISNKLKEEEYTLDFNWRERTSIYAVPSSLNISNDKLRVFVFQKNDHFMNESQSNTLIISALGYTHEVELEIELTENAFIFDKEYQYLKNYFGLIIPYVLVVLGLALLAFLIFVFTKKYLMYIKLKQEALAKKISSDIELLKSDSKVDSKSDLLDRKQENLERLRKLKQKKKKRSMLDVLVAIDKSLSETNEEITAELSKEGFDKKEVQEAIEDVEKLQSSSATDSSKDVSEKKENLNEEKDTKDNINNKDNEDIKDEKESEIEEDKNKDNKEELKKAEEDNKEDNKDKLKDEQENIKEDKTEELVKDVEPDKTVKTGARLKKVGSN